MNNHNTFFCNTRSTDSKMAAGTLNLTIEQGAVYTLNLALYSDTAMTTPIDISGYTAAMQIRENKGDATPVITLTSSSGLTIGGVNDNEIDVLITSAQTALFNFSTGYYDLEITSGGSTERLIEGTVTLSKEVTR